MEKLLGAPLLFCCLLVVGLADAQNGGLCPNSGKSPTGIALLTPTFSQVQSVMGVAVDCSRSTVYLSEAEGLRATGLDGTTKWYQPLSGGWGVALDGSTGNVYVAQYLARTVLALTPGGSLVRTIGSSLKGASGRLGSFYGPTGVAILNGDLIVADADNYRFQVLGRDGGVKGVYGSKGSGPGQFGGSKLGPFGVAVHETSQQLFLADPYNHRISRWSVVNSQASFLGHVGTMGRSAGGLYFPFGVSVQPLTGDIYALNTNNHRVEVFTKAGSWFKTVGGNPRSLSQCDLSPPGSGETLFPLWSHPTVKERSHFDAHFYVSGVAFTVRTAGYLTGIRYIKYSSESRAHTATIWAPDGRSILYQQALDFDSCGPGQWVNASFDQPVYLPPASGYVAALDDMVCFTMTPDGFGAAATAASGGSVYLDPSSAGRFSEQTGVLTTYPSSINSTNAWIDVEFYAAAAYSPPAPFAGPAIRLPYAGAFGGDGLYYVGRGVLDSSSNSTCNTWPPPGYDTIFSASELPWSQDLNDATITYTMGTLFTTKAAGFITAVRFFKAESEGGSGHVGKIYDFNSGALLATTVPFGDVGCSGAWVSAALSTPLPTVPGVQYVVAMENLQYYSKTFGYFGKTKSSGILTATGGVYGRGPGMPRDTYWKTSSYWVDVEVTTVLPPATVAPTRTPTPAPTPLPTPGPQPTSSSCDTWPAGSLTLFGPGDVKAANVQMSVATSAGYALGVRLSFAREGVIRAVRFYKSVNDPGAGHSARILDWFTGSVLATSTPGDDSFCAGPKWVSQPVSPGLPVTVGTTYLVVVDGVQWLQKTDDYFASPRTVGPITALGSSLASAGYTPWDTYWKTANFWVDVEFAPSWPAASSTMGPSCDTWPGPGFDTFFSSSERPAYPDLTDGIRLVLGHRFTTTVAGFITAVRFYKANSEGGGGHVGKIYDWNSGALLASTVAATDTACPHWVSIRLSSPLRTVPGTEYLVAIDGLMNYVKSDGQLSSGRRSGGLLVTAAGARFGKTSGAMPTEMFGSSATANYFVDVEFQSDPVSSFTCDAWPASGLVTAYDASDVPSSPDVSDGKPLVLGHRFITAAAGIVTAVRFFKAESEGGSGHVGKIYDWNSGALLASTAGFTDTTCKGGRWVGAPLSSPLRTVAGTEYLVAVEGLHYYVKSDGAMAGGRRSASLTLSAWGARFGSTAGVMPGDTFGSSGTTSYFIDVEFSSSMPTFSCSAWPSAAYQTVFGPGDFPARLDNTDNRPLVLGHRFITTVAGTITAVRFFKAESEGGSGHVGKIYDWNSGALLASTVDFDDSGCRGPRWVSAALGSPVRTSPGTEYLVALDRILYYSKTEGGLSAARRSGSLVVTPNGSRFTWSAGAMPTESWGTSAATNYFLDVEFLPSPSSPFSCDAWPAAQQTFFTASDTPVYLDSTDGKPLVLGHRFYTTVAGDLTAVRFFKANSEGGSGHVGKIYDWNSGALLGSTAAMGDSTCRGGRWVSMPLSSAVRTSPGAEYMVVVEGLSFYVKSDGGMAGGRRAGSLVVTANGARFGSQAGAMPTDAWGTSSSANYFLDVEFLPSPSSPFSCDAWPAAQQTFFTASDTPAYSGLNDGKPLILGHRFTTTIAGTVTAVRFYKSAGEGGTGHVGKLYAFGSDALLGSTVSMTDASCQGAKWVSLPLTSAVGVTPGTEYLVAIEGQALYSKTDGGLANAIVSGNLVVTAAGARYGSTPGSMPSEVYGASGVAAYFVDVEFTPAVPNCHCWPSGSSPQTMFGANDRPATADSTDNQRLVLGLRLTTTLAGTISAIRFYKAASEGGSGHTGRIYNSATGAVLASVAFNDAACNGPKWVVAPLAAPLQTTPGVEYTVAVDSLLYYVKTDGYYASPRTVGKVTAIAGVYGTAAGQMPTYQNQLPASYYIDVEFAGR